MFNHFPAAAYKSIFFLLVLPVSRTAPLLTMSVITNIENPSPQLRTVLGWIEGHCHCDPDAASAFVTDDFTHELLPARIGLLLNKEELKQHHQQHFSTVFTAFTVSSFSLARSVALFSSLCLGYNH